jgi:activator of 2-hydroxyglutaryl-CoA dehydratase
MSLTKRSVQLLKRIKVEPEVTLVGGILRWETLAREIRNELGIDKVNVAGDDMPQFVAALGCAILGHIRLRMIAEGRTEPQQQVA